MIYKSIGEIIEIQKCKNNIGLTDENLLGININKKFVPSVANTIGTDITAYKVVKKGRFACNRMHVGRDKVLPVSLSDQNEPFIVSPAYDVFVITDENVLPEYLMMWFSRKQFDKEAWFYTDGDVRGGLPWDSFCNMKLPIPSIQEQQKLVDEYNVIQNRIDLNNKMIQKLEETAQTIYKQRFVDFEFPNEEGKPYKSSGGEMVYCKELEKDIPEEWECEKLGNLCTCVLGGTPSRDISSYWGGDVNWINSSKVNDIRIYSCSEKITQLGLKSSATKLLPRNTVVLAITGATLGQVSILNIESCANQSVIGILETEKTPTEFIYEMVIGYMRELMREQTGGAQPHINKNDVESIKVVYPKPNIMQSYVKNVKGILDYVMNLGLQNYKLEKLQNVLFQKLI